MPAPRLGQHLGPKAARRQAQMPQADRVTRILPTVGSALDHPRAHVRTPGLGVAVPNVIARPGPAGRHLVAFIVRADDGSERSRRVDGGARTIVLLDQVFVNIPGLLRPLEPGKSDENAEETPGVCTHPPYCCPPCPQ